MVEFLTILKAAKCLTVLKMFHLSTGALGYFNEGQSFYDDPVPGDSFPHNMFHLDGQEGAGGSHAGTHRGF
jgi:hypothetical protein